VPRGKALHIGWISFSAAPAGDRPAQPATDTRFDNSQPLFFYTDIYDRSLASKGNPKIVLAYRVVDRDTGIEKYTSAEAGLNEYIRPGSPLIPFATQLRSEALKPGSYRLEITVHHTEAPEYVVRTADFEIADEHHN